MTYNDKERRTINRLVQAIEDAQGSDFSSDGLFEDRQTDRQQGTMLDWLMKHYQENPSEDMILQVAEKISVAIT